MSVWLTGMFTVTDVVPLERMSAPLVAEYPVTVTLLAVMVKSFVSSPTWDTLVAPPLYTILRLAAPPPDWDISADLVIVRPAAVAPVRLISMDLLDVPLFDEKLVVSVLLLYVRPVMSGSYALIPTLFILLVVTVNTAVVSNAPTVLGFGVMVKVYVSASWLIVTDFVNSLPYMSVAFNVIVYSFPLSLGLAG